MANLYVIHCIDSDTTGFVNGTIDRFGGSAHRMTSYLHHQTYQQMTSLTGSPEYIKKIAAGPLLSEDEKYMIGSAFIIEADDQRQAEMFYKMDE